MRNAALAFLAFAAVFAATITVGSDSADAFNRCKRFNLETGPVLRCR